MGFNSPWIINTVSLTSAAGITLTNTTQSNLKHDKSSFRWFDRNLWHVCVYCRCMRMFTIVSWLVTLQCPSKKHNVTFMYKTLLYYIFLMFCSVIRIWIIYVHSIMNNYGICFTWISSVFCPAKPAPVWGLHFDTSLRQYNNIKFTSTPYNITCLNK